MRRLKPSKRWMEKRGGASGGGAGNSNTTNSNQVPSTGGASNTTPAPAGTRRFTATSGADVTFSQRQAWSSAYRDLSSYSLSSEVAGRLSDNEGIGSSILRIAATNPSRVRAVTDADGNLQAAAVISREVDRIHVDLLATGPWNITGNDPRSVKGAGKAMMAEIVRESLRLGNDGQVELYALPGARGFYESIGFRSTGGGDYFLTAQAARNFLETQGG